MKTLAALIAALLLVTGCGGATEGATENGQNANTPDNHYTFWQDTPTGRVLCVWASNVREAGLSCDWYSADREEN